MARKYSIAALLSLVVLAALFFFMQSTAPPERASGPPSGVVDRPAAEEIDDVGVADTSPEIADTSSPEVGEELPTPVREVLVRGKWLLTGRIVTREEREGLPERLVPAARVKVYFKHHPNRTTPEEAPPPQTSVTGPDGRFAVVGVPGRLWLRLEVDAETYAYRTLSFKLANPEWKGHKDLGDILIEPGRTIAIKVVGPRDELVTGAEVLVGREKKQRSLSLEEAGIKESRRLATEIGDGLYELQRGPPGKIRIQVRASGYSRFREYVDVPESGPVVIRMKEGLEIAGVVKSVDGTLIEKAELEIDGPNIGSPTPTTTTDAEGRFVFDILSAGEHDIKVRADGYASVEMKDITAGVETVEFVLEKEAVLAGTVVAEDDRAPIEGANITMRNTTLGDSFNGESDARGSFEVKGLSAGTYTVSVDHDEFALFREVQVEIAAGERLTDQVLTLGRGFTATGTVVDADTNDAVPEALVVFQLQNSPGVSLKKEGETAADGSYTLKGFIEGDYRIAAKAEDYLPDSSQRVRIGEGAESEFRIALKRGGDVSGRVLNTAGYPVPGANVELLAMPSSPGRTIRRTMPNGVMSSMVLGSSAGRGSTVKTVITDENGQYALRGIPPGTNYALMAAHRDFTSALMDGLEVGERESIPNLDITLKKGGMIRGRILDEEGAGIAGAKVRATFQPVPVDPAAAGAGAGGPGATLPTPALPRGLKIQMSGGGSESVRSDANGNYLITRLTVGSYRVSADVEGRLPGATEESVEVGEDELVEGVDIILARGETLAGTVVDQEGKPIPGAEIRASGGSAPRTTTDLEGAFVLAALPADKVSARIAKTGYVTKTEEFTPPEADVVITLEVAASIVGTVLVRGTGDPVDGADVRLQAGPSNQQPGSPRRGQRTVSRARTRSDGTFTLSEVPPGDYQLVAQHNEYSPATLPVVAITSGEAREVLVELGMGGSIRGVVTGGGGPVINAAITVVRTDAQPNVSKSARTDTSGAFKIQGLPSGEYQVMARASSRSATPFMRDQQRVSVIDGQVTDVAFDLEMAVRVQGVVLAAGQPVGGGGITVFDGQGQRPVSNGRVDGSGKYQVDVPGAGDYVFQINGPRGSGGRVEVSVPRGGSTFTQDIELPSGAITGIVVDAATGAPLARARVMAVQSGTELGSISSFVSAMQSSARTDDQGRFVLGFLAPGTYSIQVAADGYAQAQQGGIRVGGRDPTGEVSVAMERGGEFQAQVVNDRGEPVPGAFGILRDGSGNLLQLLRPAVSDQNGIMKITGLLPGTYGVTVVHRAYAPARFVVGVDEGAPQGVFKIERGGKVRVQVVDRAGAAVAGARLEILDDGGRDLLEDAAFMSSRGRGPSATDDGGFVELDRVPTGTHQVVVEKDGRRSKPERIEVTADGTAELRVTLR